MADKTLAELEAENAQLREQLAAKNTDSKREEAINKKIVESHGALSRAQAILALDNQAAHDAAQKKGGAKK